MTRLSLGFLLATLVATSVTGEDSTWWQTGVIYQIYPRSFKDSNNDGIGDLIGITSKLEYLKDLGVSGVWLSPIYPSPMVDFGYDISNFTDVHPDYGTLEDFDNMVTKARQLGLKIILDFVPNHSSDKHAWFEKSVRKEAGYEDYYVWRDPKGTNPDGTPIPPNNWLSVFYGSAWEFNEERGQFYLHQFAAGQPDLNYRNPAVVQEMKDAISFWLHRGVDGFRIDAINHLFESADELDEPVDPNGSADPEDYSHLSHIYTKDFQETYAMVRQWRQLIDAQSAIDKVDRCIMVEAYTSIPLTMEYFGTPEEPIAHFPFNFQFIPITNQTNAKDYRRLIHQWLDNLPQAGSSNWLVGNHDNHRVGSRVGAELIDAMNILVLTLPGTAITYYGEEIGMVDNLAITYDDGKDPSGCNSPPELWYQVSRDFERTPFQWDDSVNAGFNEGSTPWLPVHENFKELNLVAQQENLPSHNSVYKSLVELRSTITLKNGSVSVQVQNDTLAILRHIDSTYYAVSLINFSDDNETVNLDKMFLLGQNATLAVYTASVHSSVTSGSLVEAGNVLVPAKSGLVLLPTVEVPQ